MSFSSKTMCIIDLRQCIQMRMPATPDADSAERYTTVFSMDDVDGGLTIVGTYDQLMDFAADIAQKAMSWPLVTKHTDWLGDEIAVALATESRTDD